MKHDLRDLAIKRCIEAVYTGGIVEWSANGSKLYSTCSNVVKVINLDENLSSYTIGDPDESLRITCICLDKNRSRLIVAYNNQIIREYAISDETPTLARTWKTMHTAPILCMKFNDEGSLLATGSADHNVKVWDMVQQHCTHTLKGVGVVTALSFIHSSRLMVGYLEGQVCMFDLVKGAIQKLLREWRTHSSRITGFLELPGSRRVIVVSRDQTASIIESETREVLKVFPLFEAIESAVLVHNGNMVTVGEEGTLKEWSIKARLDSMMYNPIRNQLLITSAEENIFLVAFDELSLKRQIVGFHDEVYSCCFVGKDESHLAVASNTKEIRLYDTATWDCQLVEGHSESVLHVTAAPFNRSLLASCSKDNSVIVWKFVSASDDKACRLEAIARATGHTNSVNALCFSHSGKRPFLISVSTDTTIKLWSLVDLDQDAKGDSNLDSVDKLSCSSTLVAHGKDVNCVDLSLTDSVCISGGMDKLVKLWHVDSAKMRLGIAGTLSGHRRGVGDARISPSSLKAASSSGDMTIKIWSLEDKTCLQTLNGHNSAVFRVLFVNHGTQLVSADSAGIVKIWTLATSEAETSIEAHSDKIWTLLVNSDESEYVTAGTDGRIVIWKDVSDERRMEQEAKVRKQLEEEQTLSNLLDQNRLQEALEFALGLARPFCALKVIDQLIDRDELMPALTRLDKQKIQTLLDFVTQWNTNSRTSLASQNVLNHLLRIMPPEELLELPNIRSTIESLIPYTRRHMERLNKARQDVSLLSFTWNQMRLN
uniref:Utp13 domain-containing protein n=1 Tax=Haemonchus contortus TaxID=6289 RepID=A0A7I4Y708_HAECO